MNILCLLRHEGFPSFCSCASLFCALFRRLEGGLAFPDLDTEIHSNNTAEMTAMIEALHFLGPRGPVTRDEQSCIYYDSIV